MEASGGKSICGASRRRHGRDAKVQKQEGQLSRARIVKRLYEVEDWKTGRFPPQQVNKYVCPEVSTGILTQPLSHKINFLQCPGASDANNLFLKLKPVRTLGSTNRHIYPAFMATPLYGKWQEDRRRCHIQTAIYSGVMPTPPSTSRPQPLTIQRFAPHNKKNLVDIRTVYNEQNASACCRYCPQPTSNVDACTTPPFPPHPPSPHHTSEGCGGDFVR